MPTSTTRKHLSIVYDESELKQKAFEARFQTSLRAAGYATADAVRSDFCEIDLSKCYWHDLGTLVWLVALLNKLKRQGNELLLRFPEPKGTRGLNLWHFLIRWKFFETLTLCVEEPVNLLAPEQVAHMRLESQYAAPRGKDEHGEEVLLHTSRLLEMTTLSGDPGKSGDPGIAERLVGKYQDKVLVAALSGLCGWDLTLAKRFVQEVIAEGIRNALIHGGGTFSTVVMRLDKKNLTLAIGDNGLGIPGVLRKAFQAAGRAERKLSDVDLIKYFTEPDLILDSRLIELSVRKGVTSSEARKGVGLYYMKSLILAQGGELRVRSGRALVDFTSKDIIPADDLQESPGTVFRIITPVKG